MISEKDALTAADHALHLDIGSGDTMLAQWTDLSANDVHLVHDLTGAPSYWLVGLASGKHVVGFARVMRDGTVAALGLTCRRPEAPQDCPLPVFEMTEESVLDAIAAERSLAAGQAKTAPLLVHDGPPGREVWLVETRSDGIPDEWVFVGTGGTYKRPARTFLEDDPQRE